jgi:hypothetical protein
MDDFGFLVATCLRNYQHVTCLYDCLQSLKKYHPEKKVVVIVDFTSQPSFISNAIVDFPLVLFETDTPKVPADMLMLTYFHEKHYFPKAITLQDSMKLTSPIDVSTISSFQYLWHFTNHRVHWHIIEEPATEFNKQNGIRTHDDLVEYCINHLIEKKDFQDYCNQTYRNKDRWSGCFGCLCAIDAPALSLLNEKTEILKLMSHMKDNRMRRAIESLFSLACQFAFGKEIHTSFDGLYYDGMLYHNNFQGRCIAKKSYNRQ